VFLNKEEIKAMKQLKDMREFTLLGFKPRNSLEWFHNLRTSIFVYPDNEQVKNSSIFCDAMIRELHSTDQIAICRFKPNHQRGYRVCALLPQLEQNGEGVHTPPGFNMIIIPFNEEIRDVEREYFGDLDLALNKIHREQVDTGIEAKYWEIWEQMKGEKQDYKEFREVDGMSPEQREQYVDKLLRLGPKEELVCKELIDAFTIDDFSPNYFENPEIQKFYKNLQALALNHEHAEQVEDHIQPDEEGLESNMDLIKQFSSIFSLESKPKYFKRSYLPNGKTKKTKKSDEIGKKRKLNKPKKEKKKNVKQREKEIKEEIKENKKSGVFVEEDVLVSDSL
jgi:ATP-dependent DNA helicase 2 subunit 1